MVSIKKHLSYAIIFILLSISAWQWSQAFFIYTKAHLAKFLIANAWEKSLQTNTNIKPWRWADTWPVAKMTYLQKGKGKETQLYILAGDAGNSLAFGPGHVSTTSLPATQGTSVIGGHRDTHFTFLKDIQPGEIIKLQNQTGQWQTYTVNHYWIADSLTEPLTINPDNHQLYLITCYPFNHFIPGGTQRFVVQLDPIIQAG